MSQDPSQALHAAEQRALHANLPTSDNELSLLDDPAEWESFGKPVGAEAGDMDTANVWDSQIALEGMYCSTCALTIEDALRAVPGVLRVEVSAAARRAKVVWAPDQVKPSVWMAAVGKAGYKAVPARDAQARELRMAQHRKALWRWLLAALCMMQVMMYAWPAYEAQPGDLVMEYERLLRWASWVICIPMLIFACGPFFSGAWRDLLTAYDGKSITYSGGNPTKYYNGSTFTWTQGRKLATAKVGNTNISYTYDMAGVRSSKTVGSTTYKYTTLSGLVTRQTGGNATIDFVYDESNQPLAMKYNGKVYYYVLNAQGDVVRIVDGSRNVVASYSYDPWGKLLSSSGTLANVNPLRYRGYYYDSETGFYYLQSRYYDPEIGRFINADSYASTDATGLLSTNMFAYCENNPVMRVDPTGELFWDILDVFMAALSWDDFLESPSLVNLGWAALDTLALLPGVPSSGYARRGVEVVSSISHANKAKDVAKVGWKVGDNISNLTRAGNVPSWSTVRQRYWKNEALTNYKEYSPEDLLRMSQGRAPLALNPNNGKMYPMELHHPNGRSGDNFFNFIRVTPWEHDILDPHRHFRP